MEVVFIYLIFFVNYPLDFFWPFSVFICRFDCCLIA
jgi:hypothetical protein